MSQLTNYQRQSLYETTLANDIDASTSTISVSTAPSFTLSSGGCYLAIDSDNSTKFEICLITAISGTDLTVTRGIATYEGGSSSATTHSSGAKVLIGASWQAFADIATAINSKLDNDGGNATTSYDLSVSGSNWRHRKDGNDMKFTDDNQSEITLSTLAAGGGADEKVKITVSDTTAGYVDSKFVAGDNLGKTVNNPGANETYTLDVESISTSAGAGDVGKLAELNASGEFDNSFLNTGTSNGQILVADATGLPPIDISQGTGSVAGIAFATGTRTVAAGSGTVDVNTIGFQPSLVMINATFNGGGQPEWSQGYSDGTNNYMMQKNNALNANQTQSTCILLESSPGNNFSATVTVDSAGFNIIFTMTGTPVDTLEWNAICIR